MSFQPSIAISGTPGTFVALQPPGLYMWDGSTLDQAQTIRIASRASFNKFNFLVERLTKVNAPLINGVAQPDYTLRMRVTFDSDMPNTDATTVSGYVSQLNSFLNVPLNLTKMLRGEI